ncbi:hypothetical protein ES703_125777 [subsurface metagenome]
MVVSNGSCPERKPAVWASEPTAKTSISATTAASLALSKGTIIRLKSFDAAVIAILNTPLTGLTLPSRANSPTIMVSLRSELTMAPWPMSIPRAIGKSKAGPAFFTSAGAKFINDWVLGCL